MNRLTVLLNDPEYSALTKSAEKDLRDIASQARYLLTRALAAERVRELAAPTPPQPQPEAAHAH